MLPVAFPMSRLAASSEEVEGDGSVATSLPNIRASWWVEVPLNRPSSVDVSSMWLLVYVCVCVTLYIVCMYIYTHI